MAVCGAGVRLPTVSQLHRNTVWVKTWPSPLDRAPLACSIPAHGKALGAGEGGECGKEQNSIPENGDFLPHLLPPLHSTLDPFLSVASVHPPEENYRTATGLTIQISHIPFSILVLICAALVCP